MNYCTDYLLKFPSACWDTHWSEDIKRAIILVRPEHKRKQTIYFKQRETNLVRREQLFLDFNKGKFLPATLLHVPCS